MFSMLNSAVIANTTKENAGYYNPGNFLALNIMRRIDADTSSAHTVKLFGKAADAWAKTLGITEEGKFSLKESKHINLSAALYDEEIATNQDGTPRINYIFRAPKPKTEPIDTKAPLEAATDPLKTVDPTKVFTPQNS
jgi:hypothetical protein